jgi:tRNA-specific 2-thiouridylase
MTSLRVLAALSGGVDSATAAARAAEAGHEVTAVHLALSANPSSYRTGARGCCTLEDARDARRAADVIGIPFYVWDMAERFHRDVVEDFVAEYAAGRTPNPCVRCNEKIKFAAVLDRALALGFDAVCTGHHARLENGLLRRSVDNGKDQSYVLAVLTRDQLAHSMFPLGDTTKKQVRAEAARRGLGVADKPDSHDVCFIADGDTRGFLARHLGEAPGPIVDSSTARPSAPTTAPTPSPSASAAACASDHPAADGRPRYVLGIEPVSAR